MKHLLGVATLLFAVACTSRAQVGDALARGDLAYQTLASSTPSGVDNDYRIGPLDAIDVSVFQEPELSAKAVPVDASGNISLPLIGNLKAAGKTSPELSKEIATRLGKDFLVNPKVSVVVSTPVAQKIVVQGEVVEPGMFPIEGPTTLMAAVALAKGETPIASLRDVAVFRNVGGKRTGAVFDLDSIRRGQAPDPQIVSNDIIVVGYSRSKGFWDDLRRSVPLLNVFRIL